MTARRELDSSTRAPVTRTAPFSVATVTTPESVYVGVDGRSVPPGDVGLSPHADSTMVTLMASESLLVSLA